MDGAAEEGRGIIRGRGRGTLLPDTPNKYLLMGEPTNIPETKKSLIKSHLQLKESIGTKSNSRRRS